ncbi:UNVERIFIED_CONTAM: hypothetical protein HDU68_008868 [Siphonaria sp. JEL0065]|nr:hypothetical protein HDU68_008868 [Siphonaria sp. JEL0065]
MIFSAQSSPHAISVEAIATIILFHLKTLFSPAARISHQKSEEALKRRIKKLMNDTGLCNAISFIAMFYLTRFWHECDLHDVDVDESTQFELLVVALLTSCKVTKTAIIASTCIKYVKVHDDERYSNLTWSGVSGIELRALNEMEKEFLEMIDYRVHVDVEVYEEMTQDVGRLV